jgi:hypothetical protein
MDLERGGARSAPSCARKKDNPPSGWKIPCCAAESASLRRRDYVTDGSSTDRPPFGIGRLVSPPGADISARAAVGPQASSNAAACLHFRHVREGHPEQRAASVCHRGWHERARQPRAQLPAALERRTQPRPAGNPTQSSDRRSLARSAALGPHPPLVPGPQWRPQADQRQVRDR